MSTGGKAPGAMQTIGEVSAEIGVPAHVLRFWEQRFPAISPLTRAGGRRYYRVNDVALLRAVARLTRERGFTLRGVEKLLAERGAAAMAAEHGGEPTIPTERPNGNWREGVQAARDRLAAALAAYRV